MADEQGFRNQGFSANDAKTLAWTREVHAQNAANARQRRTASARAGSSSRATSKPGDDFLGGLAVFGIVGYFVLAIIAGIIAFITDTLIPWIAVNWFTIFAIVYGYSVLPYALHRRIRADHQDYAIPELIVLSSVGVLYFNSTTRPNGVEQALMIFGPHLIVWLLSWSARFYQSGHGPQREARKRPLADYVSQTRSQWPILVTLLIVLSVAIALIAGDWSTRRWFDWSLGAWVAEVFSGKRYLVANLAYLIIFAPLALRWAMVHSYDTSVNSLTHFFSGGKKGKATVYREFLPAWKRFY